MNKIKDNLLYTTKLISIAFFTHFKISSLTFFSTIIVFSIELFLLSKGISSGNTGHVSAAPFIILLFFARPIGFTLFLLSTVIISFLLFTFTNKYVISKLINKIINDKSETIIIPLVDKFLNKFQAKQPKVLANINDYTYNKMKLIQNIQKDSSENRWLRKIILFGMKKIKLEDVDFNQEGQNFYNIIKLKTINQLKEVTDPSKNLIFITILIQWIILLFIWLTKY